MRIEVPIDNEEMLEEVLQWLFNGVQKEVSNDRIIS